MLGFVFKLALDSGLTHEQRTILLNLELLNQKLTLLTQDDNLYITRKTVQNIARMEQNLGKELKGIFEAYSTMLWQL